MINNEAATVKSHLQQLINETVEIRTIIENITLIDPQARHANQRLLVSILNNTTL